MSFTLWIPLVVFSWVPVVSVVAEASGAGVVSGASTNPVASEGLVFADGSGVAGVAMDQAPDNRPQEPGSVGIGNGIILPGGDTPCPGELYMNFEESPENGYCWQYGGVTAAGNGWFAEGYEYEGYVCGIRLYLTGLGLPVEPCQLFIWDDAGGRPGNILSGVTIVQPDPVATWPTVSLHDFLMPETSVSGRFWVGYWTYSMDRQCPYYVAADLDGFGGHPVTFISPGLGFPAGWQDVSLVWGPTQSLGIAAWVNSGAPPATESTSWGRIKNAFR